MVSRLMADRVLLGYSHRENFTTMKISPAAILIGSATASQNAVSVREINEECDPQWKPVRASRTRIWAILKKKILNKSRSKRYANPWKSKRKMLKCMRIRPNWMHHCLWEWARMSFKLFQRNCDLFESMPLPYRYCQGSADTGRVRTQVMLVKNLIENLRMFWWMSLWRIWQWILFRSSQSCLAQTL